MQVWQLEEPFCNNYCLPEVSFRFRKLIFLVQTKKNYFSKQLKNMEMNEA